MRRNKPCYSQLTFSVNIFSFGSYVVSAPAARPCCHRSTKTAINDTQNSITGAAFAQKSESSPVKLPHGETGLGFPQELSGRPTEFPLHSM